MRCSRSALRLPIKRRGFPIVGSMVVDLSNFPPSDAKGRWPARTCGQQKRGQITARRTRWCRESHGPCRPATTRIAGHRVIPASGIALGDPAKMNTARFNPSTSSQPRRDVTVQDRLACFGTVPGMCTKALKSRLGRRIKCIN